MLLHTCCDMLSPQALGGIEGLASSWRQTTHGAGSTLKIAGAAYSTWKVTETCRPFAVTFHV